MGGGRNLDKITKTQNSDARLSGPLSLVNLLIIRKLELAVKAVRVLTVKIPREIVSSNTDPQQHGSTG